MRTFSLVLIEVMLAGATMAATAPVTIYDSAGSPLSVAVESLSAPLSLPPQAGVDPTIDLWCCGAEPVGWGLNSDLYWANAFDTNDIIEAHEVTEILWYANGGEDETYWIAPDAGGFPDPTGAVLLGSQSVPDSEFMWQSFDASGAGATLAPSEVYWLIRTSAQGPGVDMTWQSTTNPTPPVQDPVAASLDFNSGWFKVLTGLNWHMEYEIRGVPAVGVDLSLTGSCPGPVTLNVSGATPNQPVTLAWSQSTGSFVIPVGGCSGTELGLASPTILTTVTADGNGDVSLSRNAPQAACGAFLQAVDRDSCGVSNVLQVP